MTLLRPFRHPLVAALQTAAGLLYPPECAGCEAALEPGEYLCAPCDALAPRIEPPFCALCSQTFGQSVSGDALAVLTGPLSCPYCRERPPVFDCAVSARRHDGLARDLIARFKYQEQHYLCRPLAGWMASVLRDDPRLRDWAAGDGGAVLVPVPLHGRRRRERGFNQAESLCRALSRQTGLPVWNALRRVRYTQTQTQLNRAERQQNLRDAIEATPAGRRSTRTLRGARVILVDDVFTTGSTVNECARALRRAGAAGVRVLTVARR